MTNILGFETSCDDTAVAVVDHNARVLSSVVYSQVKEYSQFLGVVPEIGSRAHIEQIHKTTQIALKKANLLPDQIDMVAATFGPGLIGPLMVGAQFAKGFAAGLNIPIVPVHHIFGHIMVGFGEPGFPETPFLALIASGGHSAIYHCRENYQISVVGQTIDDAAGEAFDKVGRALGLGYPAGKKIDQLARVGDPQKFKFPVAMRHQHHFNFSFSGLKTSALNAITQNNPLTKQGVSDICASVEHAIVEALVTKVLRAAQRYNVDSVVVGGGVAANTLVRQKLAQQLGEVNKSVFLPAKDMCTDNAVMIARAALATKKSERLVDYGFDVVPNLCVSKMLQVPMKQQKVAIKQKQ